MLGLTLVGEVMQRSGEDWQGTMLTVSTERPAFLAVPVPPQRDYRRDYASRKAMPLARSADGAGFAAVAAAPEPEDVPIRYENAQAAAGEFATRFKVAQPVVIKTGSEYRRVALYDASLPCQARVVVVPSTGTNAVLEADTTLIGEQPLIAGTAQLYRDGDIVGNGAVAATMPGDELKVVFGTDPALRVARKTLNPGREESNFHFFGSTVTRRYRYETTLKSGHAGPWSVELQEQLPQSDDPDVKIVAGELSGGLLVDDPEKPGLKRWKVDLQPGKSTKIVFEYLIQTKKGKAARFS
jgi:uncharacterized protein (TIGR02231 family)